ncbi:acyl-CoA thioesterase [Evansella tamaricis]|uniref:Acyl-CoA thioesterase n=1 Tax=Evansella tamaricis TaxID=2069301 RepID=A0ABS6JBS8_9BACI|nr:thioesterase family protein [Evansella tamaricis]MBU9710958.1 acyl-CoA thioesterase [Evansella tamaricis]
MALPTYIDDFESWKKEFRVSYPVTVRFSETDAFGHLNNTVAFIYFENSRTNFFKESGLMQEWVSGKGEHIPVTADLQCDFLRQIYFDDKLDVYIKVTHIGRSSLELHYMVNNENGETCLVGRGRIVQVNRMTGKSSPWSDEAINKLKKGLFIQEKMQ